MYVEALTDSFEECLSRELSDLASSMPDHEDAGTIDGLVGRIEQHVSDNAPSADDEKHSRYQYLTRVAGLLKKDADDLATTTDGCLMVVGKRLNQIVATWRTEVSLLAQDLGL